LAVECGFAPFFKTFNSFLDHVYQNHINVLAMEEPVVQPPIVHASPLQEVILDNSLAAS